MLGIGSVQPAVKKERFEIRYIRYGRRSIGHASHSLEARHRSSFAVSCYPFGHQYLPKIVLYHFPLPCCNVGCSFTTTKVGPVIAQKRATGIGKEKRQSSRPSSQTKPSYFLLEYEFIFALVYVFLNNNSQISLYNLSSTLARIKPKRKP